MSTEPAPGAHDLRMPLLAAAGWAGTLLGGATSLEPGVRWGVAVLLASAGVLVLAVLAGRAGGQARRQVRLVGAVLVLAGVAQGAVVAREQARVASPLHALAAERAVADVRGTVVSDPRRVEGRFGAQVVVAVRVEEVRARGLTHRLGARVVVLGQPGWARAQWGEQVRARGRLAPAEGGGDGGRGGDVLLTASPAPQRLARADLWWRGAAALRSAIRRSVEHRPADQAGLVPALVDGDDARLPPDLEEDFRTTGLTHLTAVSGTNLTLVVGALLVLARAVGVRGRWLRLVGLLGIVGFVLLARTEPSVLRAAAMGVVGLFAFGPDGRRRGLRALAVAVVVLLLLDPGLARSAGFALSVLATAGIVLAGPPLAVALARWLPARLAEAIAVPTAAQLACTPVVAGLSGQVSLVAVVANLLAGPLVGPATVLGLLGGVVTLLVEPIGRLLGTLAGWCVAWIILVARHGADLPRAAVPWGTTPIAITALALACLAALVWLPRLVQRRGLAILAAATLVLVVLGAPGRRLPGMPGGDWPPRGWLLAVCDVGQGDALVVSVAPGEAIVVDVGPDDDRIDACLDHLGVREIPLLVLSHYHADHIDALGAVVRGRRVGVVEATAVLDPPSGAREVERTLRSAGVPLRLAPFGVTRRIGAATVQVVHPDLATPVPGAGDGSSANDASVVLLVEVGGVRALLTGDVEPPSQADLARLLAGVRVDVLKVPHHGSARQDVGWLASLRARLALVSVGADNDYGHPSRRVLDVLRREGSQVLRTDTDGSIAVIRGADGRAAAVPQR